MLVRAVGRNKRHNTPLQLTQLVDSLHSPLRCPAQPRWRQALSQSSSRHQSRLHSSQPAQRPHSKVHPFAEIQSRRLATVADSYQTSSLSQYAPPGISDNNFQSWNSLAPSSDPDLPFIDLKEASRQHESYGRPKIGIGGSPEDLFENIETNLRVERFERCKRIIQRLISMDGTSDYIPYIHHKFLSARLDSMSTDPKGKAAVYEDMREWFDLELLTKPEHLHPDIVAIMIRGALEAFNGPKQERNVRRLYDIAVAQGDDFVNQVINSEVYTDDDLWRLVEIVPEFAAEELGLDLEAPLDSAEQKQGKPSLEEPTSHEATKASETQSLPPELPGIFADLPAIQDTLQKGAGLDSLKQSLDLASDALDPSKYNPKHLSPRERQRMIEESSSTAASARWKAEDQNLKAMGVYSELDPNRPLGAIMWRWFSALLPALQQELGECRKLLDKADRGTNVTDDRITYAAHLESIPLNQIAATTILYVMTLVAGEKDRDTETYTSNMKLTRLSVNLGKAMQLEADMIAKKKAERKARTKPRGVAKISRGRKASDISELVWPMNVKVKMGAMLVSKLIETAQITVSRPHPRTREIVTQWQPAFLHKTVYEHGRKTGLLSACPDLVQKLKNEPIGYLIAKRLPMVIEPEPWTGFSKGGYLYYPNPVIRFGTGDKVPRDYARSAIDRGDLKQVFSALDALGKTPWQVNSDVLRVQIEAWNTGEKIANFAPREPTIEKFERPFDETDANAMRKYRALVQEQNNRVSGFHSQRCFQNFQLEIARAFRHERLFFPHNIDFRGRAYPIPPYLNHMGADNARALLKFANGKELGVEGLRWLKIHLSNVFGYDKASLQERENFVMDHLDDIYDSATNPLGGRRWWLKSEDAWQTLAACYELKAALDSPDPTKFCSTLPIHQDGTCNGLQHYAALGGDAVGARQVNLEPGDRPSDVYTAVADAVKAEVEKDFNLGHPVAKILHGRITRKVVKQPVMTNVYGVTYYGARTQVKKQLEELFPDIKNTDDIDHLTLASYVAKKIFKSLGEMFTGAQAIQEWLGQCADRISTAVTIEQIEELQWESNENIAFNTSKKKRVPAPAESIQRVNISRQLFRSSVIWTTPLRLPVVQPYRSTTRKVILTKLARMALQEPSSIDPVSKRKQLQGFPPNFIHSLDATHMMMSANKCAEHGITFASIHDSFWTHACDIGDMSRILRDAFVDMHSEDIVGRLRHEFTARYKGAMYLASVDSRSPVGKKIMQLQKDRRHKRPRRDPSATLQPYQVEELLIEQERINLLRSEDPEERRRGEEMVTSGSIFAAENNAKDALTLPNDIKDAKLGEIPEDDFPVMDLASPKTELEDDVGEAEDESDDMIDDVANSGRRTGMPAELEFDGSKIANEEEFIKKIKAAKPVKKKATIQKKVFVWLPLEFPTVPEKGTFDVRRLKQSTYFFH